MVPQLPARAGSRGEFLGRIRPDLTQRRVIMRNAGKIVGRRLKIHRHTDLMNQLARFRNERCGADDASRGALNNEFDESIRLTPDQ